MYLCQESGFSVSGVKEGMSFSHSKCTLVETRQHYYGIVTKF